MTIPSTMNSILERLRNKIEAATATAARQNKNHPNSRSAGYEEGYADGLKDVWQDLTGEEFK